MYLKTSKGLQVRKGVFYFYMPSTEEGWFTLSNFLDCEEHLMVQNELQFQGTEKIKFLLTGVFCMV